MTIIDKITNSPRQEFNIILNNGETINIKLNYLIRVKGWYMDLNYKNKTINSIHLISSTNNLLYPFRHTLPFTINITTNTGFDPMFLDDFSNGNNSFNIEETLSSISNLLSVINRSLQWRNEPSTFSRRKLEDISYKLSSWLLSNMNKYREAYIIREKVHKLVVLLEDPSKYNPFVWGNI